jgi:hypothetical protein
MTEQLAKTNGITALVAGLLQIVTTFQALFVTASEYDPSTAVWMGLGLDALMAVACAAIFVQFLNTPATTPWRGIGLPMAGLASVLSLIQVGLRFSSDHGWWTGHLRHALN